MSHIRVDLPNTNNKWVEFGLANVDTFIIRIGFGLANIDTIRTLTRHEHDPWTELRPLHSTTQDAEPLLRVLVTFFFFF